MKYKVNETDVFFTLPKVSSCNAIPVCVMQRGICVQKIAGT